MPTSGTSDGGVRTLVRLTRRGAMNAMRAHRAIRSIPPRQVARGFTLIELLIVVVLIAAMVGMTVGLLGVGRDGRQLRAATRTIATELRYTRARALSTGEAQRFSIDLDHRTWTAPGTHHGDLPAALKITFQSVREEQASPREVAIRFFPDGSATGGRISLRTRGTGARVDVRWLTGEVSQARLSAADATP